MKIALVDDDVKFLAQVARLLEIILEQRGTRAEVSQFPSAEKLLARMSGGTSFDMYLLDVVMPGMDGIELGRKIRRDQPEVPILFFTTSRDFAVEAIGIEAVSYVVKPFSHGAFAEALDRGFKRLATATPPVMTLKAQGGYVNIPLRDFVYTETTGHYTTVHAANGHPLTTRLSMQEMWERLEADVRFVRVGRQLIVNLAQVKNYSDGTLVLSDGQKFVVPRRSLSEVRNAFARFYGA